MRKMVLFDFSVQLGLEAIKDRLSDDAEKAIAKDRLETYLEHQAKLNFECTREEEIDFQALADYIRINLITDVKKHFFGSGIERTKALADIRRKTMQYAKAQTAMGERRAWRMVNTAIEILRKFYRSRTNRNLLFLASEMEDTIIETVQTEVRPLADQIQRLNDASILSVDRNLVHANSGQIAEVEKNISTFMNTISTTHKLYPYYGYMQRNKDSFISIPLKDEATILYPPRFNITASSIQMDGHTIDRIDSNILNKSYRKQLPIYLDGVVAKKYLGNVLDPIQHEAEEMTGARVVVMPPEFPPAFPCSISVDGQAFMDYLLMRTKEILEDDTVVATNEEQTNYFVDVIFTHSAKAKSFHFTVTPKKDVSNEMLLNYYQFVQAINNGGVIEIKALSLNELLAKGTLDVTEEEGLEDIISVLKKMVVIEKYFNEEIIIPETITYRDKELIDRLYSLITSGSYMGQWSQMEFAFWATDDVRQKIEALTHDTYDVWYSHIAEVELFSTKLCIPIRRHMENATVLDLEKTKQKAKVLDKEDTLKLRYVPAHGEGADTYEDQIASDEDQLKAVYTAAKGV